MAAKNSNETLSRVGKLLSIIVIICVGVVVIYFLVLLATGQITGTQNNVVGNDSNVPEVQVSANILNGEIRKIENMTIDFYDLQRNQVMQLTVLEYAILDKYNPSTNTNEELKLEQIQPATLANLTLDDQGQVTHITVLPAVNISGEVANNQAGVITLKFNNVDYTVRVNANTKVNRQTSDNTLENDLTVSNIQVGDIVSIVSDNETKVGSKSFVAGLISILLKP